MPEKYEMQVSMYIRDSRGGNLNVSETVSIEASSFLEIAKILGTFHDLAQSLKTKEKK